MLGEVIVGLLNSQIDSDLCHFPVFCSISVFGLFPLDMNITKSVDYIRRHFISLYYYLHFDWDYSVRLWYSRIYIQMQ